MALGAPNEKAELTLADEELTSASSLGLSEGLSPKVNSLFPGGVDASCGLNPSPLAVEADAEEEKLNAEKLDGAAGIDGELFACEDESAAAALNEGAPNPVKDEGGDGAFGAFEEEEEEEEEAEEEAFCILSSYSVFRPDLRVSYRFSTSAMLVNGSASTAFLQAERNATFRPRSPV